jgi:hypothetical protein
VDVEIEDAAPPGSSENPIHSAEPVALDGIHTVVFLSQLLSDSIRMDHSQLFQTPPLLKIFNGLYIWGRDLNLDPCCAVRRAEWLYSSSTGKDIES